MKSPSLEVDGRLDGILKTETWQQEEDEMVHDEV